MLSPVRHTGGSVKTVKLGSCNFLRTLTDYSFLRGKFHPEIPTGSADGGSVKQGRGGGGGHAIFCLSRKR